MGPKRKVAKSRRKRHSKWVIASLVLVLVVVGASAAYVFYPKNPTTQPSNQTPQGLTSLANQYMAVMQNLNSSQTQTEIAAQLGKSYNQTDLFTWEHSKLTFTQPDGMYTDPQQILQGGKGICVQWSILYVSACLAEGYPSRLVAAVDTSSWNYIHVWAEDYHNGYWVHVDPSDSVWDNPARYQGWDWGAGLGSSVRVYAFMDNSYVEVTDSYAP
jgi:transglutaminase-like putative cysteine protease